MISMSETRASLRFTPSVSQGDGFANMVTQLTRAAKPCLLVASDGASPGPALLQLLSTAPTMQALILDTPWQPQARQAKHLFADLGDVLDTLPRLKRLFANGSLTAKHLKHASLESLYLLGDPLNPAVVETISVGGLPALKHLGISLSSEQKPAGEAAALKTLSLGWKTLEVIQVDSVTDLAGFLKVISKLKCPLQRVQLTVSAFPDEDEFLAALSAHAAGLKHVKTLELPFADYISEPGIERARSLVPSLTEPKTNGILPSVYAAW